MAVQPGVEGAGDTLGVALGELGPGALEELVDGLAPEREPALEVALAEGRLGVDRRVGAERAAAVGARAEQDRLPERRDLRHVRLEVEVGDVGEDIADDRVGHGLRVERADEALAVGAGLAVGAVAGRHARLRIEAPGGRAVPALSGRFREAGALSAEGGQRVAVAEWQAPVIASRSVRTGPQDARLSQRRK